jgi:hypothetical protein
MNTFITYEQAASLDELQARRQILMESCAMASMWFAKNTHAQLVMFNLWAEIMEAHEALQDGDLSPYLFNRTSSLLNELEEKKSEVQELGSLISDLSEKVSSRFNQSNQ